MTIPTIPEGFIPWAGGECPVPVDMVLDVFFANGTRERARAEVWTDRNSRELGDWWKHTGLDLYRIIAYRPDPNYVPVVDWQAHAEKAEAELADLRAKAEKLVAGTRIALKSAESWIYEQLVGTYMLESELAELDVARAALAEWEGKP